MAKTPNGNEPPQHSLAEIQAAIEAVMLRLSSGKSPDASLAASLAGNIQTTVNDPKSGIGVLGGSEFERLVTERAPKLNETVNDPAAQRAAAKAELDRTNVSGVPLSNAARAALDFARFAEARGSRESKDGGGARFDSMGSSNDWSSAAGQAQMRELAIKSGLGWAADNPDLLRMGPAAIQVLADVKLREDTFKHMTKAGMSKESVVGFANMSRKNGDDPETTNKNAHQLSTDLETIGSSKYTGAVNDYLKLQGPDTRATPAQIEAAKKKIQDAGAEVVKQDPSKAPQVEDSQKLLKVKTEQKNEADNRHTNAAATKDRAAQQTEQKGANADAQVAKKESSKATVLAAIDDDSPVQTSSGSSTTPTRNTPAAAANPKPAKPQQAPAPK
jgi:hypothetical protein